MSYSIRKNKIVWLENANINTYCNLPREARSYVFRQDADDKALELAHENPGHLFEVWNKIDMKKVTTIMFAPDN